MADTEIESFLIKFKQLCNAGINATFNVNSLNGKAIVTLHADLGSLHKPNYVPQTPLKQRSPAYSRRLARRQAMRQSADNLNIDSAEAELASQEMDITDVEAVKPTNVDMIVKPYSVDKAVKPSSVDMAEKPDKVTIDANVELRGKAGQAHSTGESKDMCNDKVEEEFQDYAEEVDVEEQRRDKLVEDVVISKVTIEAIEYAVDVEKEIRDKFGAIGVTVKNIRLKSDKRGMFQTSLVNISAVNLNKIWGRRLGLKNCSVIEFKKPD